MTQKEFRIIYNGDPDCTIELALMDLIERIGGEWIGKDYCSRKNETTIWFEIDGRKINADGR